MPWTGSGRVHDLTRLVAVSSFKSMLLYVMLQCMEGDRLAGAIYRIDRRRIVYRIDSLMNSAKSTVFARRVSHNTLLRSLQDTERKKDMRSVPKADILQAHLLSIVGKRPVGHFMWRKSEDSIQHKRLCFTTACSCDPENTRRESQT